MGILSLIFWSLVLIVTVKYVTLIMRADNRGEGGILALMALAQRVSVGSGIRNALTLIGIAGACLFFGDGVITPAISVLSAVEGLEVSAPELQQYVLPISVVVIVAAVRDAVAWHRQRRPHLRPGDGGVVRRRSGSSVWSRSCVTPSCCWRSRPATPWGCAWHTRDWRSSCWEPWCCASPVPRRCTPTWGISARSRSG